MKSTAVVTEWNSSFKRDAASWMFSALTNWRQSQRSMSPIDRLCLWLYSEQILPRWPALSWRRREASLSLWYRWCQHHTSYRLPAHTHTHSDFNFSKGEGKNYMIVLSMCTVTTALRYMQWNIKLNNSKKLPLSCTWVSVLSYFGVNRVSVNLTWKSFSVVGWMARRSKHRYSAAFGLWTHANACTQTRTHAHAHTHTHNAEYVWTLFSDK